MASNDIDSVIIYVKEETESTSVVQNVFRFSNGRIQDPLEDVDIKDVKKRKRNTEFTKKEKRKRAILSGQAHLNTKGELVGPRTIGPDCNCKNKCFQAVPSEHRNIIFREFYSLNSYDEQNAHLYGLIQRHDVQRKREVHSERRTCTFKYFVRIGDIEVQVCKKAFANIHGISDKKIRTLCLKQLQNIAFPRDNRGRHRNRPNKKSVGRPVVSEPEYILPGPGTIFKSGSSLADRELPNGDRMILIKIKKPSVTQSSLPETSGSADSNLSITRPSAHSKGLSIEQLEVQPPVINSPLAQISATKNLMPNISSVKESDTMLILAQISGQAADILAAKNKLSKDSAVHCPGVQHSKVRLNIGQPRRMESSVNQTPESKTSIVKLMPSLLMINSTSNLATSNQVTRVPATSTEVKSSNAMRSEFKLQKSVISTAQPSMSVVKAAGLRAQLALKSNPQAKSPVLTTITTTIHPPKTPISMMQTSATQMTSSDASGVRLPVAVKHLQLQDQPYNPSSSVRVVSSLPTKHPDSSSLVSSSLSIQFPKINFSALQPSATQKVSIKISESDPPAIQSTETVFLRTPKASSKGFISRANIPATKGPIISSSKICKADAEPSIAQPITVQAQRKTSITLPSENKVSVARFHKSVTGGLVIKRATFSHDVINNAEPNDSEFKRVLIKVHVVSENNDVVNG